MLPDPADRNAQAGRSDYTAPVIDLMDAADGIYTRMLEHIDDARSRIIIAEALLTRRGAGRGVEFDMGQRVFTKVKYPAAENPTGGLPIEKVQFDMHVAEHLQALDALQQRAIQAAGYSTRTDQGASTTTIVEALHPDWSQGEIDDEVGRIENVAAVMDPATFRDPSPGLGI